MRLSPAYFTVAQPFRVWRHVGKCDSNTHIGRSRAVTTVLDAVDALPGDEVHDLPGGTFVTGPDGTFQVSLRPPVPILESRHHYVSPENLLRELASAGRVAAIPAPMLRADYGAARRAVDANRLPPLSAEVRRAEPSPELRLANALVDAFLEPLAGMPNGRIRTSRDVTCDGPARARTDVEDGGTFEASATVGRVVVRFSDALAPGVTLGTMRDGLRHVSFDDPATAARDAAALATSVGRTLASEEPAPSPGR